MIWGLAGMKAFKSLEERFALLSGEGKASLFAAVLVSAAFALALWIRVALPYESVFTPEFVRFGGNDPWYNMRLVESTLEHFPHRIIFDAFTFYPHGSYVPFALLFDWLLSFIIWLLGFGNPYATLGQHGIETIAAFYPAVLGALTVLPVYFIAREVFGNRLAGVLSAFLVAAIPGQFLTRSILGFTDHHVMETLFSTIFMLYFILALRAAKAEGVNFESLCESFQGGFRSATSFGSRLLFGLKTTWRRFRKTWTHTALSGIWLGLYILGWRGGLLFVFVAFVCLIVLHVAEHLRSGSAEYLGVVGVPTFLIAAIIISPFLHPGCLTGFHVYSPLIGAVGTLLMSGVSVGLRRREFDVLAYPLALGAIAIVGIVALNVAAPSLYKQIVGGFNIFSPRGGALTIAEVHPTHLRNPYTGKIYDFQNVWAGGEVWQWFLTTFFVALFGMGIIGYEASRKFLKRDFPLGELTLLTWSLIMLYAMFGQNRFAAYYAVNAAILCGGFSAWLVGVVSKLGMPATGLIKVKGKAKARAVKGGTIRKPRAAAKTTRTSEGKPPEVPRLAATLRKYLTPEVLTTLMTLVIILVAVSKYQKPDEVTAFLTSVLSGLPVLVIALVALIFGTFLIREQPTLERSQLVTTLSVCLVALLLALIIVCPPLCQSLAVARSSGGPSYDWYEALSWMRENTPEQITPALNYTDFYYQFYEPPPTGEDYKYPNGTYSVMSWWDYGHWITRIAHRIPTANPFQQGIGGPHQRNKPGACVFFINFTEENSVKIAETLDVRYVVTDFMMADVWNAFYNKFNAMTVWANDESGYLSAVQTEEGVRLMATEKYFRTTIARLHVLDGSSLLYGNTYIEPLRHFRLVHESPSTVVTFTVSSGNETQQKEIKFVKVFEYVKGAKIVGNASVGSVVELSTNVTTNAGRTFVYAQQVISNGTFEFVVPYSTEGTPSCPEYTKFDVIAEPYVLRVGRVENNTFIWEVEKEVHVDEESVVEGRTIKVSAYGG
ncbi:MAG: Asparagine N-glycosylation enzyme [Candidatus Alkanophagales archaeon MCA70_species_2]|nr:Asparagine N-glycosylation enzyme [Candidatus Alkanophaga liquidiphilum]